MKIKRFLTLFCLTFLISSCSYKQNEIYYGANIEVSLTLKDYKNPTFYKGYVDNDFIDNTYFNKIESNEEYIGLIDNLFKKCEYFYHIKDINRDGDITLNYNAIKVSFNNDKSNIIFMDKGKYYEDFKVFNESSYTSIDGYFIPFNQNNLFKIDKSSKEFINNYIGYYYLRILDSSIYESYLKLYNFND